MEIDQIDVKILRTLIKDSRTSLKDIAKDCGVSPNAIFKRIKQLEDNKVIIGYSVMMAPLKSGPQQLTVIWLTIDLTREAEAMKYLHKDNKFNIFRCTGSFDIVAYYFSSNMQELEAMLHDLKKQEWSRKIIVNLFSEKMKTTLENIILEPQPKKEG